jgi:Zn-dependent protease
MTQNSKPFLQVQHQDMTIALFGSNWTGKEQLHVNGKLVSNARNFQGSGKHTFKWDGKTWDFSFELDLQKGLADIELYEQGNLVWQTIIPFQFQGKLADKLVNLNQDNKDTTSPEISELSDVSDEGRALNQSTLSTRAEPTTPDSQPPKKSKLSFGLLFLGLKLFKSAKLIQVGLVGASVASYSFLFDWRFAVIIVMALMFHEYGHMQAMKKMGMKVKGMYLIPFIGGAAVTTDRIKTRWENVFISMMGPVYGLIMTVVFFGVYLVTNNSLAAGLAGFSALLNLINLLPIMPLDGGHVVKSIAYSINSKLGTGVLWAGVLLSVLITWKIGFSLFAILTVIGALDILFGGSRKHEASITPLNSGGVVISTVWYLGSIAALVLMILLMIKMDMAGSQLISQIVNS